MSEIVLSGVGLVSAYGTSERRGVPDFLAGLAAGRPPAIMPAADQATRPIDRAQLEDSDPTRWLAFAITEALSGAGWPDDAETPLLLLAAQAEPPVGSENPLYAPGSVVAGRHRWEQPLVVSHACASALFAVDLARRLIESGAHDSVLVAGVSVCNPYSSESLRVVKAIGSSPSRPFDRGRDGILIGEGSGAVLVERASTLAARNRSPLVELAASVAEIGGNSSAASDTEIVLDCMTRVLDKAGALGADYVHAHATGTVQGDAAEVDAVARLVAERRLPDVTVSSHKGALGHLLHVSAFPGLVAAIWVIRDGLLPSTIGLRESLPVEGVHLPPQGPAVRAAKPVEHALVNAFGFGGNNASVLLRRSTATSPPHPTEEPAFG